MHGVAEWLEAATGGGGESVGCGLILSARVEGVAQCLRHGDVLGVLQIPAFVDDDILPAELLQLRCKNNHVFAKLGFVYGGGGGGPPVPPPPRGGGGRALLCA